MEFIVVLIAACGIFAICFAVFLMKARRSDEPPRLHTCAQGGDCQCHGEPQHHKEKPFDLIETLENVKREGKD